MPYTEALFYFMSGTGNSYRVACWLDQAAKEKGIKSGTYAVDVKNIKQVKASSDTLIGLIMPTHGFTAPWLIIWFALRIPKTDRAHAIVVSTRGGTKVGPLFFPGMNGTAGYLAALILALKGYIMRGVIGIDMPANWTALHWGMSPTNAAAIVSRAKVKVSRFAELILSGRKYFSGFVQLLFGLLLLPVSFTYLLMGRFGLSKLFFATEDCTGCGLCADSCPAAAIKMYGKKPYWTFKCESCMRCMNICPTKAIEASHPFAAAIYFLTAIPFSYYILNGITPSLINNVFISFIVQYAYYITSIFLAYWVFYALNRIPIICRIFTVTTLTHYYRRYHEPDTKLSDLVYKNHEK